MVVSLEDPVFVVFGAGVSPFPGVISRTIAGRVVLP